MRGQAHDIRLESRVTSTISLSIYMYYIYVDVYIYIYIYIKRISEGSGSRPPVVGVAGGHYFDFKGHLIDIIESCFFPASDRFHENVHFSWA